MATSEDVPVDIVQCLLPFVCDEMRMPAGLIVSVIEEIERLRALVNQIGDALLASYPDDNTRQWSTSEVLHHFRNRSSTHAGQPQ